jgi:signal transduction histidine kinase
MKSSDFQDQRSPNLILILYISAAIFIMIAVPFLASRWNQSPFLGSFLTPTLEFKKFSSLISGESWQIQDLNLGIGTQLTAINERPVDSSTSVSQILSEYQPGDTVTLSIISESKGASQIDITLTSFPGDIGFIYVYLPLFIALFCFLSGLWVFSDQRKRTINMAFTAFAISTAILISTYYDYLTTHQLVPFFYTSIGIAAASLIQAAFLLPYRRQTHKQPGWLSYIAYPHNIILIGLTIYQRQNPSEHLNLNTCTWILIGSLVLSAAVFILFLVMAIYRLTSPIIKRQYKLLTAAAALSFLPSLFFFIISRINGSGSPANPFLLSFLCVLPITYTLQIRRYLLPQTKKSFYHSLVYIVISVIFGVLYLFIITILNQVFIKPFSPDNALIIGIMIFLVAFTIDPIRRIVQRNLFAPLPSSEWAKTLAMNFSSTLTATNSPDFAVDLLKDTIEKLMNPRHVHIFLYDPQIPGYSARTTLESEGETELVALHDSVIATTIEKMGDILYFREDNGLAKKTKSHGQLLDEYGSCIFAPIPGSFGIHGWAAIGPKQDGNPYSIDDIDLIGTLTHQFSMVYERADAMISIRDRLQEMEILNHIAAAINKDVDFDDLLLSIYREIHSIIPIDRFSLVMDAEIKGFFNRLFLFENGKILISTDQPRPLPEDFIERIGIEKEKPEIVHDECNWLVVPLFANERIIGALSVGHTSDKTLFERIDLNLVNSIANLVSGAIVKADLLRSSQQQGRQLATLNRVSQQLTSTLVLESLLKNILNGAIEILDCTSGILMITDKTGDTLEFRVTAGPIGTELRGKRLGIDQGIAGQAYMTKKPVIQNVIDRNKLDYLDVSPAVRSRIENVLAVPLIARGVVIGVLDIINKKNKAPFTENDVNILQGFANHAAIAIHNATLYTQTDKALENRIEELYVMQKIDRDLNSSREITQALQVILQAAIAHTHAGAGSIGRVDRDSFTLTDFYQVLNDTEGPNRKENTSLKAFPWIFQEEEKGYQVKKSEKLSEYLGIPKELKVHHFIIPDLNESNSILLLMHLDSSKAIDQEDLEFLTRLSDHAMIALRNIFLYQELNEAIQIKNDFISFISHELKNPLTVIKGYADILRKGMAGEVNEEQSDFLSTITHNVKHMNTFITDLSDQSQIETKSLRLIFEQASIVEVIDEVLHTYENQIKEKAITVHVQAVKEIPDVWCDRVRLVQILSNLISNAIKYTPSGGKITVGAQHAINEWDEKGAAEVVHVWVEDNGLGVLQEDQKHLFEKFFRGTDSQIRNIPGTGLGLRISKTLAEMMGGTLWFESTEGEGSTFHFTMPI